MELLKHAKYCKSEHYSYDLKKNSLNSIIKIWQLDKVMTWQTHSRLSTSKPKGVIITLFWVQIETGRCGAHTIPTTALHYMTIFANWREKDWPSLRGTNKHVLKQSVERRTWQDRAHSSEQPPDDITRVTWLKYKLSMDSRIHKGNVEFLYNEASGIPEENRIWDICRAADGAVNHVVKEDDSGRKIQFFLLCAEPQFKEQEETWGDETHVTWHQERCRGKGGRRW